jgi:hypothetical protein
VFKVVPASLSLPWDVVTNATVGAAAPAAPGGSGDGGSDDDEGADDNSPDGYDSANDDDSEAHEDWFKHVTIYLRKMMRM